MVPFAGLNFWNLNSTHCGSGTPYDRQICHPNSVSGNTYQRTYGTIITSLLRQNDVATSFWRNDDFIIALCAR